MMRTFIFLTYFVLMVFWLGGHVDARAAWWKPERLPGSARLSLEAVRSIHLPPEPSPRLAAAVEDLLACWPIALARAEGAAVPPKQVLVLERDTNFGERGAGFSYRRDRTRVTLRAASDEALADGLYALCRELLGVRWYWAGDLGKEVVGEAAETFPDGVWRERPAFVQRTLYPVETDFGRRNGLNRVYSFNHNLARIFTQEVYQASPEAFAEIGGVRQAPKRSAKYDAQPDFTHPRTVELAARAAREHFDANPDANSFSLSINDNSLFDEGERTARAVARRAESGGRMPEDRDRRSEVRGQRSEVGDRRSEVRGQRSEVGGQRTEVRGGRVKRYAHAVRDEDPGQVEYFRGRPNYTDLVFGFMNQVATRLYESGQVVDRCNFLPASLTNPTAVLRPLTSVLCPPTSKKKPPYLTALAYYWTEQSPSFRLHPQVMPVLTSDRAQWHDPEYRAQDKALIRRWVNSGAARIATWDYYFGAPYPYPRQFTQWIGESIPYLHEAGVDVFFSQLPSIWGLDGPKAWLTAELLRDPQQDVAALLREFYENFFGPAAAPIREFYEIAEQTRNERAGTANWIKFYKDEAGIELFPPETLVRMRGCIDRAMLSTQQELRTSVGDSASSGEFRHLQASTPLGVGSGRFVKRVEVVSEAFAYTEAYAAYHRSRVRLMELAMGMWRGAGQDQVEGLLQALADYQLAKSTFDQLKGSLAAQPMHRGFATFNRLLQTDPLPLFLAAAARAGVDPARLDLSKDVAAMSLPALRAWHAGEAEWIRVGRNPELKHSGTELRNFLGPELPLIDGWEIQYRASEGLQVGAAQRPERAGWRVENADIVSLAQTYPVVGERAYLLQIDASWQVSPDNRSWVQLNWKSISGEKLRVDLPLRMPNGNSDGPRTLQFALTAPVNAYDLQVAVLTNRQYAGDFIEVERVEFGRLVGR